MPLWVIFACPCPPELTPLIHEKRRRQRTSQAAGSRSKRAEKRHWRRLGRVGGNFRAGLRPMRDMALLSTPCGISIPPGLQADGASHGRTLRLFDSSRGGSLGSEHLGLASLRHFAIQTNGNRLFFQWIHALGRNNDLLLQVVPSSRPPCSATKWKFHSATRSVACGSGKRRWRGSKERRFRSVGAL